MKRISLSLIVLACLILVFGSRSWASCPQDSIDHGDCDTLNVQLWPADAIFTAPGHFARVPIYVTHDMPADIDSIAGFAIPLCYTQTNPAKYCSLSSYWNTIGLAGGSFARSIFRTMGSDTSWMKKLYDDPDGPYDWANKILNLNGTTHFWLTLIPTTQPLMSAVSYELLATMTFKLQDTMHVCIDSCFWPPSSILSYSRKDAKTYVPRDNMPYCFWIGPPRIQVIAPNGGEHWAVGASQNITWLSENFSGANVKIDYSTNSGSTWLPVIASTTNNGNYPWTIPNTPSTQCRVRVSDTDDDPFDISDADFWIVAPDFVIKAEPDTQIVQAGLSTNYNVILTSQNGFASPCSLSVAGLPAGATAGFNPNPTTPTDTSVMTVGTTAGVTPPGTYQMIITAFQFSKAFIQHKDTVFLKVTPAVDFTIDAKPDTQTVQEGNSANYDVILTSLNGFASPCSLSVTGLPAGASPSFNPNPMTPTSPPDTSDLTVSTTAGVTPTGIYKLFITAKQISKGLIQHSDSVFLKVTPKPDFTIQVKPDTQEVQFGDLVNSNVILTSLYGFANPCTLSVTGLPANASVSFNPNPVTPTDTSVMTVTTAGTTPLGTYNLTVTAAELSKALVQHSVQVVLKVTYQVNPDTQEVQAGDSVQFDVIIPGAKGIPPTSYALTVDGLPLHATGAFDPNPVSPPDTSVLTIQTQTITPGGTYRLTITATVQTEKGTVQYVTHVVLIVHSTLDFTLNVLPDTMRLPRGRDSSYTVTLDSINGFNSPCTLTVAGLPVGASGTFQSPLLVPPASTKLNIHLPEATQTGYYTLIITGTEKFKAAIQHSDTVTLVVTLGTWAFAIDAFPDTQKVVVGDSTQYNVLMTPNIGFTHPCTLSIKSGLPSGASYHFDPVVLAPNDTSILTILTSGTTPAGEYLLTIKGTANPKESSTTTAYLIVQDFSITASPETLTVTQGQSVGYKVKLTSLFEFNDPCTLTVSGLPNPPDSGVFDKAKLTPTDSTFLYVYTAPTDTGWYALTITAQRMLAKNSVLHHSYEVHLHVMQAGDAGDWADNPNSPKTFALFQNQPNPFNPDTKISYSLPQPCHVSLIIYNLLGQKVRTLFNDHQEAGMQTLTWDGRGDDGAQLSSGIYFYRLQAGEFTQTKKMSLLK